MVRFICNCTSHHGNVEDPDPTKSHPTTKKITTVLTLGFTCQLETNLKGRVNMRTGHQFETSNTRIYTLPHTNH